MIELLSCQQLTLVQDSHADETFLKWYYYDVFSHLVASSD
jgi:hypothetical protein